MESQLDSVTELQAAQAQIETIIRDGFTFQVPSVLMRLRGKRERTWHIEQPYLGTLGYLSRQYATMSYDPAAIDDEPWKESSRLIARYSQQCAYVVALSVLNSPLAILLGARLLSWYFLWRVKPDKLHQLIDSIMVVSNMGDFIAALRYMAIAKRTTEPRKKAS